MEAWRTRPLDETPYVILDARYERVREGGAGGGLCSAGGQWHHRHRASPGLGVSVALLEAEVHWRAFLDSLIQRGLRGVKFLASDDHAGRSCLKEVCIFGSFYLNEQYWVITILGQVSTLLD